MSFDSQRYLYNLLMPNTHRRRRRDETVLSRRRPRCEHNSQLAHDDLRPHRLHICLTTWIFIDIDNFFNNDDIMTSLMKNVSISIKIDVIKRYRVCLVSLQIVDRIHRQSSWASCELCSHRRRRRDKTVSSRRRRRCVLCISTYQPARSLRSQDNHLLQNPQSTHQ